MISPTVFARRCLCYLAENMSPKALGDAIQGQVVAPDWPTAYYLQAAALLRLGMESDARESLRNGAGIERRRATSAQVDETEDMILEMPEVNKDAELYGVPRARLTRRRTS